MTDPLDKELRDLIGYRLRRATSAVMPEVKRLLLPFGLRRTTFSALTVVKEKPSLSQSQLGKALCIERPNMVQIIDELEEMKLVERRPAPNDRRTYALKATPKGIALQEKAHQALSQLEQSLMKGMSHSDIDRLQEYLNLIEANASNIQQSEEENIDEPELSRA